MKICNTNKQKTAFRTQYSYFKHQVMFFGLFNTLIIFQKYVIKTLAEKLDIFMIIYLDNILIYTKNLGQFHIEAIHLVFDQLQKNLYFAKLKKCRFYKDEVCFLGYVILLKEISMKVEKIKVMKNWLSLS